MRFVSKVNLVPAVMGMKNGQYIFSLGGKEYLSDLKDIFSQNFLLKENQIIPINYDDGKRLVLAEFSEDVYGNDVEIVDAHNASIFGELETYRFAWISGETLTKQIYCILNEPNAHITINLLLKTEKWFIFPASKEVKDTIQVYL